MTWFPRGEPHVAEGGPCVLDEQVVGSGSVVRLEFGRRVRRVKPQISSEGTQTRLREVPGWLLVLIV